MLHAGKIVAHAFFPGDVRGGEVHFDADETWTVTASKGFVQSNTRKPFTLFKLQCQMYFHNL